MKKMLVLGVTAFLLIALSNCQFNLFAAFDRIDIPGATELNAKASSNPDGFVSDVSDYVDNNFLENPDVTTVQVDAIVTNLETIYTTSPDTQTGQQAAVLAGEIIITSDPVTSSVVNGVVGAVSDALAAGGTIDPDTLISSIFPEDLDLVGLQNILNDLDDAAAAYANLAPTLAGNDPEMTSGEVGDMAQLAVVALAISDLRNQVNDDTDLLNFITSSGSDPLAVTLTNPLDTTDGAASSYESELQDILTFSGLAL